MRREVAGAAALVREGLFRLLVHDWRPRRAENGTLRRVLLGSRQAFVLIDVLELCPPLAQLLRPHALHELRVRVVLEAGDDLAVAVPVEVPELAG